MGKFSIVTCQGKKPSKSGYLKETLWDGCSDMDLKNWKINL